MIRLYFYPSWDETPAAFLERYSKQSPARSGMWGDIKATLDPSEADYHVALNATDDELDPERTVLFAMEPPFSNLLDGWEQAGAVAKFPIQQYPPPVWWWQHPTYDELKAEEPPTKTDALSWITSDLGRNIGPVFKTVRKAVMHTGFRKYEPKGIPLLDRGPGDGHILRMEFLDRLTDRHPRLLDLYGRGDFSGEYYHGEIADKRDGLTQYRYSLAVENYRGPNYFTGKLTDPLLAWCMPIYWGCTNIDEYLPEDAYVQIDIEAPDAPDRIKEIVESERRERNIDAIAEARERILDDLQFWPTTERRIKQVDERLRNSAAHS